MTPYDHKKIEPKWQKEWEKKKAFAAVDQSKKKKWYSLIEFPYPSGDGLHVGHIRSNTAMDIISRKRRREGFNVLYPIGWDAFGLPTENYAIKTGIQPAVVTEKNTGIFRRQLKSLGFSFDWSREINTTDPKYYKWTQWIFLQFLKAGLAYKKKMAINWCPKDLIGLANEEVVDGKCERCGTPVEKREKEQWMLAITKYADRLDKDLDLVNYLPEIKTQQRNWIGKSEGAEIEFPLSKKYRVVMIHGYTGSPDEKKYPWLREKLEKLGYEVEIPRLPNTNYPNGEEQVDYVIKNCHFDENTILFGHSLGAVVALKVLQKINKPVAKLVLAAMGKDPNSDNPEFKNGLRPRWKNFSWDFDFEKIKKLSKQIVVLSDLEEKERISYMKYISEKLNAKLIEGYAEDEHFTGDTEPIFLENLVPSIEVFTTRPDTLFGVTYVVLAPEHPLVRELLPSIKNRSEVLVYLTRVKKESDIERTDATREKTGVELKGVKAVNPVNSEEVPIYIADYVLADYGTGAVMAVPAHDDRDWDFAKKYDLPIKEVIAPYYLCTGNDAPKKDVETLKRKTIDAIIENEKGEFLLIKETNNGITHIHLVGGGTDGEEDKIAVEREVKEETGYTDFEILEKIGSSIFSLGFRHTKNKNQDTFGPAFHVKLKGENKVKSEVDESKHELMWVDKDKVKNLITWPQHLFFWNNFLNPNKAFTEEGKLINSAQFNGKDSTSIKKEITTFAGGQWISKYKLRDWIFSRQRYWGEPIPVVHCEKCGIVPVPEKDLPVKLPPVKNYKPTETGESPLATITKWVNVKCPKCKGPAKRETDTMPNWAGSSWYYLRYTDPKNAAKFADMKKLKYWTPVDWYNGGMEHVTLHLLYSRFWHKFLFDKGLVPTSEPYTKRTAHGFVLGPGGEKMSKSRGNVINPDTIVKNVGADSLRLYEMFMGPFDQAISWDENGIVGCRRFLERVWKLQEKVTGNPVIPVKTGILSNDKLLPLVHKTIKKVSEDIENMRFNTAVSALMILLNEFEKEGTVVKENFEIFLKLLAPFAPHLTEELWNILGHKKSIHIEPWLVFDPSLLIESSVKIAVQVNGKTRAEIEIATDATEEMIKAAALALEPVKKWLNGKAPSRIIVVKGRLINIVCPMSTIG
jgi:leucyl-tRNA synthetase